MGVRVTEMGEDRMSVHHRVVSRHSGRVAAEGEGIVVMFDYKRNQKAPISPTLRAAITKIENDGR